MSDIDRAVIDVAKQQSGLKNRGGKILRERCFDPIAQSELLRLGAGDSLSVQGAAKLGVFRDKSGEHRTSPDVTAAHVLALRHPKKSKPAESSVPPLVLEFDDALPIYRANPMKQPAPKTFTEHLALGNGFVLDGLNQACVIVSTG